MPDNDPRPTVAPNRTRTESGGGEGEASGEAIPALAVLDERRYEVGEERGRGGIGVVFETTDRLLGRQVALKQPQGREDGAGMARFMREALIAARLQHPAIVPVYDFGVRDTGVPWYSMRLVPGATLRDAIAGASGLDERLALLPHVQAVADALAYAHEQGVVHRDLKPGNVLVGPFGETVVIDWGLAKEGKEAPSAAASPLAASGLGEPLTRRGAVLGTPGYMAPEQAAGEEVDERADVFAIGAILYQLLTGTAPYPSDEPGAVLAGPPVPVEAREPGAPRDLVAIVTKAMARERARRYATAAGLALDLKRFATGQLVGARHYSRWSLARRWLRRHRAAAVASAAVVAALVTGGVGVVRERNRTAAENNRLRLVQAQTIVERDPTAAAAWLKGHRPDPALAGRAVEVAARAEVAGVARHVLTLPGDVPFRVCLSSSGKLAGVLGRLGALWLYDLAGPSRRQLGTVGGPPGACAFLEGDARLAAAPAHGGPVRLVDLTGAQTSVAVPGDLARLRALAGGRLLVSTGDGRITLVGAEGVARPLANVPAKTRETVPAPDGRVLYALADSAVWRVPLDGGPASRVEAGRPVRSVDPFLDGRLALGTDTDVGVHDLATGQTRWRHVVDAPTGQDTVGVRAVAGGVFYVTALAGTAGWWDLGETVMPFGVGAFVKTLQVTSDQGRALWADEGGTIHVADLAARSERTLVGDHGSTIHVTDAGGPTGRTMVGDHTTIRALAMSSDGRWLAATHGAALRIHPLPPPHVRRLEVRGRALVRAMIGRAELASVLHDDSLVVFDVHTGARRPVMELGERISRLAASLTGSRAAVVTIGGRMVSVDVATRVRRELAGGQGPWIGIEFGAGDTLLAVNDKGELHAWDTTGGAHRLVARAPSGGLVGGLTMTPDGSHAFLGSEKQASLVDVASGRTTSLDFAGGVYMREAVSRDGSKVLISVEDGRMLLWEGAELRRRVLGQLTGGAADILFLPGERAVLVADESGDVNEIELRSGARRAIGRHPAHVNSAALAPSGRWVATNDVAGEIRVWDLSSRGMAIIPGRCKGGFLRSLTEDRVAVGGAGGCAELDVVDPAAVVPSDPQAMSAWLDRLTSARVDQAGEPVTP